MKDSKTFWDKTAPRYAKSAIRDEETYQKKLAMTQAYFQPDWSVMEFGCGTGSTAIIHAPFVKDILATDISDKMLEIGEQRVKEAGVENIRFQQGTLDTIKFESNSFDAVLGLNILHLLDNLETVIAQVYDALKPGGIFVSSTALIGQLNIVWKVMIPAMQLIGFAPYVNRFNREELLSLMTNAGFTIEEEWQPGKESIFIVARK